MVLIKQLHLPHSQPSELVKMSEENEYRLRRLSGPRFSHCTPIQMHEEAMFERVYCKIVVRMLMYAGLMSATRRMICWRYCVEVIFIAEPTDRISWFHYYITQNWHIGFILQSTIIRFNSDMRSIWQKYRWEYKKNRRIKHTQTYTQINIKTQRIHNYKSVVTVLPWLENL